MECGAGDSIGCASSRTLGWTRGSTWDEREQTPKEEQGNRGAERDPPFLFLPERIWDS